MFQRSSIGVGYDTGRSICGSWSCSRRITCATPTVAMNSKQSRLVEQPSHDEELGEPAEHRADEDRERHGDGRTEMPSFT